MIQRAYERYCWILEAKESDPEYLALWQRFWDLEPEFLTLMQSLSLERGR